MKSIGELKEDISIEDMLLEIGARVQTSFGYSNEKPVWCPFCTDIASNNPGATVNVFKGLFHCFVCGVGGDIITLARIHLETEDTRAAMKWLEDTF